MVEKPKPVLVGFARYIRAAFKLAAEFEPQDCIVIVKRVKTRRLENMDALVAALKKAFPGTDILERQFEQYSFRDQLQLVGSARVLIGLHGAALSFIPFLSPRFSLCVELLPYASNPADFAADFFGRVAAAAQVPHVAIAAKPELQTPKIIEDDAPMSSGLVADVDAIVQAIEEKFNREKLQE